MAAPKTNSERGRASRRKGKSGELELAHQLTDLGFPCRRAQQYCGSASSADILGLQGIHPECKRTESLSLYKAMDQAIADSAGTDDLPAVFHRRSKRPWLVVMKLEDWAELYRAYREGVVKDEVEDA